MPTLGSLGVVHEVQHPTEEEVLDFDWFGAKIRLTSDYNEIEMVDLMETMSDISEDDPRAIVTVKDTLRLVVDPDDFTEFWRLAKENRQKIGDLIAVGQVLMEAVTARPTQQPSDSSPGRLTTPENSPAASSSPEVSSGMPGRPDLVIIREDDAATRRKVQEAAARGIAASG